MPARTRRVIGAERIRTDFYEGEPFLLARGPADENAFVYVAVPPERVWRALRDAKK